MGVYLLIYNCLHIIDPDYYVDIWSALQMWKSSSLMSDKLTGNSPSAHSPLFLCKRTIET